MSRFNIENQKKKILENIKQITDEGSDAFTNHEIHDVVERLKNEPEFFYLNEFFVGHQDLTELQDAPCKIKQPMDDPSAADFSLEIDIKELDFFCVKNRLSSMLHEKISLVSKMLDKDCLRLLPYHLSAFILNFPNNRLLQMESTSYDLVFNRKEDKILSDDRSNYNQAVKKQMENFFLDAHLNRRLVKQTSLQEDIYTKPYGPNAHRLLMEAYVFCACVKVCSICEQVDYVLCFSVFGEHTKAFNLGILRDWFFSETKVELCELNSQIEIIKFAEDFLDYFSPAMIDSYGSAKTYKKIHRALENEVL